MLILVAGASGDLAKKKTYPALFDLFKEGLLPAETVIWGFARSPKTHESFREHIIVLLKDDVDARNVKRGYTKQAFLDRCFYRNGRAYGDAACLQTILNDAGDQKNVLVYLAVPPHVFGETTGAIRQAREQLPARPGWFRVVLEKPFGRDLGTCEALLRELEDQKWPEKDLYRIDHYLGKG